jgi:hypothetical protein
MRLAKRSESDRSRSLAHGLQALGADVHLLRDSILNDGSALNVDFESALCVALGKAHVVANHWVTIADLAPGHGNAPFVDDSRPAALRLQSAMIPQTSDPDKRGLV